MFQCVWAWPSHHTLCMLCIDCPLMTVQLKAMSGSWLSKTNYNYNIKCFLQPSVCIMEWRTALRLAEFAALLQSTHKEWAPLISNHYLYISSLKDAVKESVREVGRQSKLTLRHFIANKELAQVEADLHLPIIVLPDAFGLVALLSLLSCYLLISDERRTC